MACSRGGRERCNEARSARNALMPNTCCHLRRASRAAFCHMLHAEHRCSDVEAARGTLAPECRVSEHTAARHWPPNASRNDTPCYQQQQQQQQQQQHSRICAARPTLREHDCASAAAKQGAR
eukprot:4160055-Alexandrium_andersonii.AAC.1